MTYSILWTTIPVGLAGADQLRISLIASPRVEATVSSLGSSPLASFPALVPDPSALRLQVAGQTSLRPLTRVTGRPDLDLWRLMLPAATRAKRSITGVRRLRTTPDESYVQAAQSLDAIFADGAPTQRAAAVIRALDLDPDDRRLAAALPRTVRDRLPAGTPVRLERLTGRQLADTTATLRRRGHVDLALALPLAAHVAGLRTRTRPAGAQAQPGPLDGIAPIGQAEFHQLVAMLLDHPVLAAQVGLRSDYTVAAAGLAGVQRVRIVGADGTPLNGPVVRPQPWSQVRLRTDPRRFTMDDAGEIRGGLLDLATSADDHVVARVDVTGLAAQLVAMRDDDPTTQPRLPVRRNAGLTLARANRPSEVVEVALDRAQALFSAVGGLDGAPVLTAADVTLGYRLDVATDGQRFRSLMRHRVGYTVGTGSGARTLAAPAAELPDSTEGRIQRAVAVQQDDVDGTPQLRVGEEVTVWDGWSLVAPRPGRTVTAEPGSSETTAALPSGSIPGVPVTSVVTAEPGSVPRLRFGHDYAFRGRAVYLGGASLPPDLDDDSETGRRTRYLRTAAVAPPVLVHRRRNVEGESLNRVVVRSDGDGNPIGPLGERHIAAPKTSVQLAEWHGVFDTAYGPDSPARAAARAALLAVAKREAGSFLDPGPGAAVVTNDPAHTPPVTLPPPKGDPLPNGAYVVHDTSAPTLPYLPEVPVDGAAFTGLRAEPVILPYAGSWPAVTPGRLVVHPIPSGVVTTTIKTEQGRPVLHVELPPGVERTVQVSSTIRADRLAELDRGSTDPQQVISGQDPLLSSTETVTLVHAVRRPISEPRLLNAKLALEIGATSVLVRADLDCHRGSTGRVDLEATWSETIDSGSGPVQPAQRTALVGSTDIAVEAVGGATTPVSVRHHQGDTRHRLISYAPVASTRFAEYFPGRASGAAGQRRGQPVVLNVPNRGVPPKPVVRAVLPLFTSSTEVVGSMIRLRRRGTGIRVLLERGWNATGDGEQLGVVAFADEAAGNAALAEGDGRLDLVSRWGSDPLQEQVPAAVRHVTAGRFGLRDQATTKPRKLLERTAGGRVLTIVGHRVQFDPVRDLWFADVDLTIDETVWPFVRLALVRYQPDSVDGCHISEVVRTDFVQIPASRVVEIRRVGQLGASVIVQGKPLANGRFVLRQERRVHDADAPGIDLYSDAGVADGNGWRVRHDDPADTENALAVMTLEPTTAIDPDNPVITELFHGRLVVEEHLDGMAIAGPGTSSRVVFAETLDRRRIGIGNHPAQP